LQDEAAAMRSTLSADDQLQLLAAHVQAELIRQYIVEGRRFGELSDIELIEHWRREARPHLDRPGCDLDRTKELNDLIFECELRGVHPPQAELDEFNYVEAQKRYLFGQDLMKDPARYQIARERLNSVLASALAEHARGN
jgi:hypothetical protein